MACCLCVGRSVTGSQTFFDPAPQATPALGTLTNACPSKATTTSMVHSGSALSAASNHAALRPGHCAFQMITRAINCNGQFILTTPRTCNGPCRQLLSPCSKLQAPSALPPAQTARRPNPLPHVKPTTQATPHCNLGVCLTLTHLQHHNSAQARGA
jgi:hypothetical protein